MEIGKVVGGSVSEKLIIRLKSNANVDVGDILKVQEQNTIYYVKVINIGINSMIPGQFIEDIAGQELEHEVKYELFDEKDRFYKLCEAKTLKVIREGAFGPARTIPNYFANVNTVDEKDFEFLKNKGEIPVGWLRLGMKNLPNVIISLPARTLISHHVLVSAATGKGKSNFAKVFIRGMLYLENSSTIVLDPHNEYYGEKGIKGLRDHNRKEKLVYFTPRAKDYPGAEKLMIHSDDLEPSDFYGIVNITEAQQEAMDLAHRIYSQEWIRLLVKEKNTKDIVIDMQNKVQPVTIAALKRKLNYILELEDGESGLTFTLKPRSESSIFERVKKAVSDSKIVIIDSSLVGDEAEKLIAGSIVRRLFLLYRKTKQLNPEKFDTLPELMILFEEAPRVLGKDVLAQGTNIFERIAREGRKFKVGLCAITQMPSLLPREILSQMNTKIILGIPSPSDRRLLFLLARSNQVFQRHAVFQLLLFVVLSRFERRAIPRSVLFGLLIPGRIIRPLLVLPLMPLLARNCSG